MSEGETIPVILIGVNPIKAEGFQKLVIDRGGLELFFYQGDFTLQMKNDTLVLSLKSQIQDPHSSKKERS